MFKFLIIIFLFFFILMRLGGFFLRVLFGRAAQQANQQSQHRAQSAKKPADGNVNIDYVPKEGTKKTPKNFKGGDYVDYEEVKE